MFGHDDTQNQSLQSDPMGYQPAITDPTTNSTLAAANGLANGVVPTSAAVTEQPAPEQPVAPIATASLAGVDESDDLISIKQQALQQLTPLVGHLEQTPEEKFRTTMMLIQASDNQALVKEAYDAAKEITDEKARAQALLDVVNEINYFTQQHNN